MKNLFLKFMIHKVYKSYLEYLAHLSTRSYCSFLKLSKPILGNYTGITLGLGYVY